MSARDRAHARQLWSWWLDEGFRVAMYVGSGAFLGAWLWHWQSGALVGLLVCVAVSSHRLMVLRRWQQSPQSERLPEVDGLWGEVFDGALDRQRKFRKKKKRLARLLGEFQASTAALPFGAVVLGKNGEMLWFNNAARTLLGLRAPRDTGLRITNLLRHPAFVHYFESSQESGESDTEIDMPSPVNDSRTLALRIVAYGSGQRLLVVRDVSERVYFDTARRDFVANASHELRTPLTVLRGYLEMMQADAETDALAPWKNPIDDMHAQVMRMEALITDMLTLARVEAAGGQTREDMLDIPALLERDVAQAEALSAGRHRFDVYIDPALMLQGDARQWQSLAGNLLSNAVRYTHAEGVITVYWRSVADDGAELVVRDTGIGISEADIPRLTERFYRVDQGRAHVTGGGTGLGLSIVKHALQAFDAQLHIESAPGQGSTFTCTFPSHRVSRLALPA